MACGAADGRAVIWKISGVEDDAGIAAGRGGADDVGAHRAGGSGEFYVLTSHCR